MKYWIQFIGMGLIISFAWSCKTPAIVAPTPEPVVTVKGNESKIDFNINALDENGLMGERTGKVAVDYQFCFTAGTVNEQTIQKIDPSIRIQKDSRGRAGCKANQSIARGNSHQANAKNILLELSNLDYVGKIKRVWFE